MSIEVRKLFFDSIGEVSFVKNKKARRLIIKVKPDGNVRVTVPFLVSYRHATSFVEKKMEWIIRAQKNVKESFGNRIIFLENNTFKTKWHTIVIEKYDGTSVKVFKAGYTIKVCLPETYELTSDKVQEKIRQIIVKIWRYEANEILTLRLNSIAEEFDFKFKGVSIKNMRTRWGSCSHTNKINLNLHLIRLPDHLRDYIILHELIHTVHKNHGRNFWDALIKANPEARKFSRELREIKMEMW